MPTDMEYEVIDLMIDRLSDDLHERYMESKSWGDDRDFYPTTEDCRRLLEDDIEAFKALANKLGFDRKDIEEKVAEIRKESNDYLIRREK